jgi:putative PIN family toxin of toxin-antitoxin system
VRVVVDTNIWVSGLILPDSPPGRVLVAVRDRHLTAVASWGLAEEIVDVLRRPKLAGRYGISETDVADVLALLAPLLPEVDVDVPLRDPDDVPVVAAAVAGGAQAIITGDADLLADPAVRDWLADRSIEVITATEVLRQLG